jgi:uncharacterized protein YgbK (DUF1537 family)
MTATPRLLLAYYGDDFTGSTDALEVLARAGARTALFLAPPTPAQLARHPGLQAVGVAGLTRALAPDAMTAELQPAFTALRALGPRHVHYKVCSTFDSSPTVGSIGRAIEVGAGVFGQSWVPLLVGAPALGRHCVFGNLFARMGTGGTGEIHRLDRHPSMSRHPVTPAHESDLRLHLAKQTTKRIGLFDILHVSLPPSEAQAALDRIVASGAEVVLFDALHADQMARLGAWIDGAAGQGKPFFSVGSSGLNMALGNHWAAQGALIAVTAWADPGPAAPLLVVSGSCSPVTAGQIAWAEAHGFAHLSLDPAAPDIDDTVAQAVRELHAGRHTIVSTCRGEAGAPVSAQMLGTALGRIARDAISRTGLRRLVVAGGDTSSYAGRELGIEGVEMLAPLAPGAPLCRAFAPGDAVDGLEVVFKGGQIGAPDFFGAVVRGRI